jgi:hypothetical protein
MIYFHFLGRQTGKTTKAIEIFNSDVDNMFIVPNTDIKHKTINKIKNSDSFNKKHEYLLDRRVKTINDNLRSYRCNNLIIDEPLVPNFNFISKDNKSFGHKLNEFIPAVKKDIIIFQSIEDTKLFDDIQISKRIFDLYNFKTDYNPIIKDILETIEEMHHQIVMVDLLSEEVNNNEIISLEEFRLKILNILQTIPFNLGVEIIINKLPE